MLENTAALQNPFPSSLTIPAGLDQVLTALPKQSAVSTLPCMVMLCLQHKIAGAQVTAVSLLEHHLYEKTCTPHSCNITVS